MSRGTALSVGIAMSIVVGGAIVAFRMSEPGHSFAAVENYDLLDDGRTIVLTIGVGRLHSIGYIAVDEDANSVRVRVLLLRHFGSAPADLLRIDVRAMLANTLGSRSVLDHDGRTIPRRARGARLLTSTMTDLVALHQLRAASARANNLRPRHPGARQMTEPGLPA